MNDALSPAEPNAANETPENASPLPIQPVTVAVLPVDVSEPLTSTEEAP